MRVPLLLLLPSQEPLVESATAAVERRAPAFGLENAQVPHDFELDPTFAAVPVGSGTGMEFSTQALAPTQSEQFTVRGTIEVEDPIEIPASLEGRPIYADPVISMRIP